MRLQEIGSAIRTARSAGGLTQAELADRAGLSRTTLNQLENGLFPDIGVKKVQNVLDLLGLDLSVIRAPSPDPADPDRKSTRLNSSHLVISYAVFCLKK